MDATDASHLPRLQLYKCIRCRRAFFSEERRRIHFLTAHSKESISKRRVKMCNANKSTPVPVPAGCMHTGNVPVPVSLRTDVSDIPVQPKLRKTRRYRYTKYSSETVLQTLILYWPPKRAFDKICAKHHIDRRKAEMLLRRMISDEYCPILHGSLNVHSILLEEYAKDSTTNQQRTDDLGKMTGLSHSYIRLWFYWRRKKGHQSIGNKLLCEAFFRQPYPDDECLQWLISHTRLSRPLIHLWFRLMRAKYEILEFREVEEKLLWAWFLKEPESLTDSKEVEKVCYLVGMKNKDVRTLFEYWRIQWYSANRGDEQGIQAKTRNIHTISAEKAPSSDAISRLLERARSCQKLFGVPTNCKITDRQAPKNTPRSSNTSFDSYVPKKFSNKQFARNAADRNSILQHIKPLLSTSGSETDLQCAMEDKVANFSNEPMDNSNYQGGSLPRKSHRYDCFGSLTVQCDVLEAKNRPSPVYHDEKMEHNLYSLFNTRFSWKPRTKGHIHEVDENVAVSKVKSSLPSNNSQKITGSVTSGCTRLKYRESDVCVSGVDASKNMTLLSGDPSEVIDLTQDSDSSIDEAYVPVAAAMNREQSNRDASLSAGDCIDDEYELCDPDRPLIICESDDEDVSESVKMCQNR